LSLGNMWSKFPSFFLHFFPLSSIVFHLSFFSRFWNSFNLVLCLLTKCVLYVHVLDTILVGLTSKQDCKNDCQRA
jgi:hypothetical protein